MSGSTTNCLTNYFTKLNSNFLNPNHTVDGRNPAAPGMYKTM